MQIQIFLKHTLQLSHEVLPKALQISRSLKSTSWTALVECILKTRPAKHLINMNHHQFRRQRVRTTWGVFFLPHTPKHRFWPLWRDKCPPPPQASAGERWRAMCPTAARFCLYVLRFLQEHRCCYTYSRIWIHPVLFLKCWTAASDLVLPHLALPSISVCNPYRCQKAVMW